MKLLLVSQYFWPESFRINDLAVELVKQGHEVTVLTGKPNYPKGNFYKGYGFWGIKTEYFEGVKIIRLPIIPRGKGGGLNLIFNYLSYAFITSIYAVFHNVKYDASFVFATSPITAAFPALVHKRIYKTPVSIWVQDLWPESVTAAGNVKSSFILKLLKKMVFRIYRGCDRILISSKGFKDSIVNQFGFENKIVYVPNWAEDLYADQNSIDVDLYKQLIPEGFVVMFAGNIGEAQDFENILLSVEETQKIEDIKWVIIGDGRKKSWLEKEITSRNLKNIFLLGRFPVKEMPSFFYHADLMLMTLKDEYIFSLTVPSKLQSYMASGKAVATMLNGEGSTIVHDADCGLIADASDYKSLTQNVISLYNSSEKVKELGQNGKEYYQREFLKEKIVDKITTLLSELNENRNNRRR